MTTSVFLAVIGAALLHATWNALLKGGSDKLMAMTAVVLGHLPVALLALLWVPLPAAEALPYLLTGVALHVGYQFFLLGSYAHGDLTQVYPIARGSAPLIVVAVSVLLLGVQMSSMELSAVLLIGAGIISLTLVRRADGQRNGKAALLAFLTGCFIASYSLNDGLGARLAGTSLGFYAWLSVGNGIVMSLYVALRRPSVFASIATHGKRMFLLGGSASFVAYAIVTWAFTESPIALVTALRETSIVFALLIGVFFLKERLDLLKVASTMTALVGAILLRVAKH